MINQLPSTLKKISSFFERLPGIGQKTANRLSLYLLRLPEEDLADFGENISSLKKRVKLCRRCYNFTEDDLCAICQDEKRDRSILTVVETVLDLIAFEQGGIYQGTYFVLHGRIDPLNNIGPDDIYLSPLLQLVRNDQQIKEIIIATNPDMEGESTAAYIRDKIKKIKEIKISRLAYGLPIGASLEYADYMTLKKALDGRLGL